MPSPVELDILLTAVHETGHAVISYAAGLGCGEIALAAHVNANGVYGGTDGEFGCGLRAGNMIGDAFERREYNDLLFRHAIMVLAGMAAERKAMICLGVKPNVAAGGSGDRSELNAVAKLYLRQDRRRSKSAFAASIWTRVQAAVDDPRIWNAIVHIATRLSEGLRPKSPRKGKARKRYALPGRAAAAVMLRYGVRARMLG